MLDFSILILSATLWWLGLAKIYVKSHFIVNFTIERIVMALPCEPRRILLIIVALC